MNSIARYLTIFAVLIFLPGCADMFGSSSSKPSTGSEPVVAQPSPTYYDQSSDIPIPSDMEVDRKRSLASTTQEGIRIGLITVTGRVDTQSLCNAMIHNMARGGWSLRGATTGMKTIQIYEKGNQYAVLYIYDEMFTTVMEIWGAQRLANNVYPAGVSGGYSSPSSGFVLEPTAPAPAEENGSAPVF